MQICRNRYGVCACVRVVCVCWLCYLVYLLIRPGQQATGLKQHRKTETPMNPAGQNKPTSLWTTIIPSPGQNNKGPPKGAHAANGTNTRRWEARRTPPHPPPQKKAIQTRGPTSPTAQRTQTKATTHHGPRACGRFSTLVFFANFCCLGDNLQQILMHDPNNCGVIVGTGRLQVDHSNHDHRKSFYFTMLAGMIRMEGKAEQV